MAALMTDAEKQALLALASRCETEEPSRELDVAIAQGVWPQLVTYSTYCVGDEEPLFFADPFYKQPCPPFTTSLDAAVTLVPEGWGYTFRNPPGLMPVASVWLTFREPACDGTARTMAASICAAALRARAA